MSKARNSFEQLAAKAAGRLDKVRASGQQLSLLPDEAGPDPVQAGTGKAGRPKGATGKGSSQLRRWLAERGMRMPEDQLAEIAGLASSEGPMLAAMERAELMLGWAFDGADTSPSPEQRLAAFLQLYAMSLRAAEALLPYGTPKAAPEGGERPPVVLNILGGSVDQPRDVTPKPASIGHDLAPADVRWNIEQNQRVSATRPDLSDGEASDE